MTTEKENPITTELAKQNVTDAVIAKIKKDFLPLKINGIEDKEGYKKVHDARMQCRDLRTTAEKICKKGREDAIKEQKAWISKEKEVVAQISEVEQHLKKQEDAVVQEIEGQKMRAERLLKLPGRKEQIVGIESYFAIELNDNVIMSFDDPMWNNLVIMAKDKKIKEFEEKERIRKDQEKQDRIVLRTNLLFKAGALMETRYGLKGYIKGSLRVEENTVADASDEDWTVLLQKFINEKDPAVLPEMKDAVIADLSYKSGVTDRLNPISGIQETSDEEKLFNYASALEKIPVPEMKTEQGKQMLHESQKKLNQVLTILRS